MTWILAYFAIWLVMSIIISEVHLVGKRPLPAVTCVIAGSFWPFSMMALVLVLLWWAMRVVGAWFR